MGTVYPAKSWAPRGRAHEYYRVKLRASRYCQGKLSVHPSIRPCVTLRYRDHIGWNSASNYGPRHANGLGGFPAMHSPHLRCFARMRYHVQKTAANCFAFLRQLRSIRRSISCDVRVPDARCRPRLVTAGLWQCCAGGLTSLPVQPPTVGTQRCCTIDRRPATF